jgi:uncharacterized protein YyaL (SSP411 family)
MARRFAPALALLLLVASTGCASRPGTSGARAARATTTAALPEGAPREELAWATFSPETFARAKAERKYIVMDGSAEWCHWCHVMEATTYHDPAVRKILDERFIAVKVDVDARPDLEERYGDWGWPATIVFSPDAAEVGKYRGYIEPGKFAAILNEVVASEIAEGRPPAPRTIAPRTPLSDEHLDWIQHAVDVELDDYYDDDQGGWGRTQKAPLGWDNAWTLFKAEKGDAEARKKAIFTLDQQSKILDPVWGGIYQYSAARNWDSPHFEKLMTFQAPALDNYATAYRLTRDPKQLARANAMLGYIDRFMKGPDGGFYTTQDADLNAHDRTRPFMSGHEYYAKDERARLAAGLPRVDTHEYGRENGLAIAAYVTMYEVTKDASVLASAERAARHILSTHLTARGGIAHDRIDPAKAPKVLYLSDNAAFGFALARLYEVTHDEEYLRRARGIADFMLRELADEDGGGLFAASADPDAVGVFAVRRVPFEDDVMALRTLARIARASTDASYRVAIGRILRAISTPEEIKARGRWLGDYLLALEETRGVRSAVPVTAAP